MRPMRRPFPLLLLALAASALPVHGATCALDGGPAATLLLPYFEVDLANPNGRTTLFSVNNAGTDAVLAHVVLWTDVGVPTLAFDVFLTGYDLQTINLRDVFQGRLPQTADAARDLEDLISPRGDVSRDGTFPNCGILPLPVVPSSLLEDVRRAHAGMPAAIFDNKCAGLWFGQPTVVRGYATIDVAKACSAMRPGDPGYFGPNGVAGFDNVLWGDFFYVDPAGRFAQGDSLVRIEADPERFGAGDATFYARWVDGSGADAREPLARLWASRFINGGTFTAGTHLVGWRDGPWTHQPFSCLQSPAFPPGVPETQKELLVFDEEEEVYDLTSPPTCPFECPPQIVPTPFPAAATLVAVGGADLPVPFDFGWLLTDLGVQQDGVDDPWAQSWVGQIHSAAERFSVGFAGTQLDSVCPPGRCSEGQEAVVGELCVVGPLAVGQPARFTVRPQGCFSSSCTVIHQAGCAVEDDGPTLRLDALFCLQPSTLPTPCTADCNGGGVAQCSSGALAAGAYTAQLGSLLLHFEVPGEGACVGSAP
jgi:hypothetical protein